MDKIETLSKILEIREQEKNNAQLAHTHSVDQFEKVATDLYNLMREKEDTTKASSLVTKNTTSIETIKEETTYINHLSKRINVLQNKVNKARNVMETKQGQVTNAHVEMKKIEKMIEFRQQKETKRIQKLEDESMDEISIQQYLMTR